jgi:uncharacterized membrane protein
MTFAETIDLIGKTIDAVGVGVMVMGALIATVFFARRVFGRQPLGSAYRAYRQGLGRSILLGLEFLVAGDIIRTVAISPTFESVGVLAAIVGVRTFLSMTLEVEFSGRWPWQRRGPKEQSL